jgi:S1-C subfamily serine protease
MANLFSELSNEITTAVERASRSVVQVYGHRRPVAGVVFAPDLIVAPARALGDEAAAIRRSDGNTVEGQVLGHAVGMGLGVVRVGNLGVEPAAPQPEPPVGSLAITIGRTWSGAVIASVTNVAVVGGPLRTGRASEIARVIRIAQPPHGAFTGGALIDGVGRVLGVVTGSAIRGTTIVIPATLAWDAGHHITKHGGTRQGFLGVSTIPVALPAKQRGNGQEHGLLVTAVGHEAPADQAGLFVGDVIVSFDGEGVQDPEALVTLLRGDRIGKPVTLSLLRGVHKHDIAVVVGERPSRRG